MTSPGPYIEIFLWDDKKEEASPLSSIMEAFLHSAGRPQTAAMFCRDMYYQLCVSESPGNPAHLIDLDHFIVVDINILKRPYLLQHESILFHLRSVPDHDPESDFYILADRNIDATSLSGYLSHQSQKLVVDTTHFIQAAPPQDQYGSIVWKMSMPQSDTFNFKFNLPQLATLLSTVSNADKEYNVTQKNCYWFTRMVRELVARIVNDAAAAAHQEILPSDIDHGSYLRLWHTGHFLSFFCLDGYSPNLADILYAKYKNEYQEFANNVASLFFQKLLLSLTFKFSSEQKLHSEHHQHPIQK